MFEVQDEPEEFRAKTKTQPQMGGGGKPPRPTAVGLSDGGYGDHNFIRGQVLRCIVVDYTSSGYSVNILGTRLRGVMKTVDYFAPNSEIQAAFVQWSSSGVAVLEPVDAPTNVGGKPDLLKASRFLPDGSQTSFQDIFGRSALDGYQSVGDDKHSFRRAVDLLPPPLENSEITSFSGGHAHLKELVDRLSAMEFNGILIGESSQFFSRGAILFHRGKSLGAIYSSNFERAPKNGVDAIRGLLNDLLDDDACIDCYDLPAPIIRSYAALFVGGRLETHFRDRGVLYHELLLGQFEEEKITGVISLSIALGTEQCFILVVDGVFREFFFVQSRVYGFSREEFTRELRDREIVQVDASLLKGDEESQAIDVRDYLPFS